MTDELYTTRIIKNEGTEDGDRLLTWEVRAKGFVGARAFQADQDRFIPEWIGCGDGWLKATYHVLVDGAEVAIEAANDAWASQQQAIEDAGMARAW